MPRGGKQPGAGRPKGKKNKSTLEKESILRAFKERVLRSSDILFNSQITLARGQMFLYKIEKEKVVGPKGGVSYRSAKPVFVTNQQEIEDYLEGLITSGDEDDPKDPNATYYFITTKEPNNQAIDSMLDRTFGKPKQSLEVGGEGGGPVRFKQILDEIEKE